MRKSRFTEAQTVGILQESAVGAKTPELLRSLCRYRVHRSDDDSLRERIKTLASEKPRWDVPRIVWRLHRDG